MPTIHVTYSTQGHCATLEAEIPDEVVRDPEKLQASADYLWAQVKSAVERQVQHIGLDPKSSDNGNHSNGNGVNGFGITTKQIKFIKDLAQKRGRAMDTLLGDLGKQSLTQLTKTEASCLIDELRAASHVVN